MIRAGHRVNRQLSCFAAIGAASTVAYLALFALLRPELSATGANAVAMLITAIANTSANRRYTFGVRDTAHRVRHHVAGLLAFATALAITSAALGLMELLAPAASPAAEATVLVGANLAAAAARFGILRRAVVHGDHGSPVGIRCRGACMTTQPTGPTWVPPATAAGASRG